MIINYISSSYDHLNEIVYNIVSEEVIHPKIL